MSLHAWAMDILGSSGLASFGAPGFVPACFAYPGIYWVLSFREASDGATDGWKRGAAQGLFWNGEHMEFVAGELSGFGRSLPACFLYVCM